MELIDTHCHLDFDHYDDDREEVIGECTRRMESVVNSGTNLERNSKSLELAREHDVIHPTAGFHPTYVEETGEGEIGDIEKQVRDSRDEIVAVGEIGLDYHHVRDRDLRSMQEDHFRRFLGVAEDLELPVVVHSRDAEGRVLEILESFGNDVVLHCFNGRPELALEAVDRGYMISVSTQVLYSGRVQDIVEEVPLESTVLETDAPFLYRGERNVPWNIEESAERIAELKGSGTGTVARVTSGNARDVFSL